MISPLVAILLATLLFYVAIPGAGAFGVRRRWRRFRSRVIEASLLPPVTYASVRAGEASRGATGGPVDTGAEANARFVGTLESIQGEQTAWIRGSQLTIAVDMTGADVYMVSGSEGDRPGSPPARTTWARVGSLPEGVRVLVSGRLDTSGSHPVIRSAAGEPVLAVFFDGPAETLVRRCVWSGRQLNEYWNSVTPGALAGGAFALIILAYVLLRQPMFVAHARMAIALAAVPVLPLLPPGVGLFYLYRLAWRTGRTQRAHRDILRLPLRYFAGEERCVRLANGGLYCRSSADIDSLGDARARGLTIVAPPVDTPPRDCIVFGRPGPEMPEAPDDPLTEWVAIQGDPDTESAACQRRARRYELASGAILGLGLLVNFVLVVIVLVAVV